jgi:RND family efflux transporter MFP subunit
VARELEFAGRISPVEETPLYFKTSGYVKQVLVQPGDQVKAGDLLAELEAGLGLDSLQDQVASAELDLVIAQARLTQAEEANAYAIAQAEMSLVLAQEQLARTKALYAGYNAGTVQARVGLEEAEGQVARAQTEYQEALDRPWEPQDVRDAYALALQQAQWNLETAHAQYDQAIATQGSYRHESKIAEIAVDQAEAELEQLKKGIDPVLAIEVQRTQQALDQLRESTQIIAPLDGEVVSLSLYPGRPVEPFRTVIVIADPSAIEVGADLTSDELADMTEGQEATVVLRVNPDRSWIGTVRRLPYPYGTGGSAEDTAGLDNSTRISLEGNVSELRLGDLVHVTIVLEENDDALWLPPDAIRTFQNRTFVIVLDDAGQHRVYVEMGIESQDQVEILKGLEEGQVVVAP